MNSLLQPARLAQRLHLERLPCQRLLAGSKLPTACGPALSASLGAAGSESLLRSFSSLTLRRPPKRGGGRSGNNSGRNGGGGGNTNNNRTTTPSDSAPRRIKLRTHAVSLGIGDYTDNGPAPVSSRSSDVEADNMASELALAESIKKEEDAKMAKKLRWVESARPPVRKPIIDERGRAYGRGGRKTASSRVWIQPGFGLVTVNRVQLVDYFQRITDREHILAPLAATRTLGKFDITCFVQGGGSSGQTGAIRHGLARALNAFNPDAYRPALKRLGYLTRDPRKVERKKIGHVKARKMPQWVKR